MGLDYRWEGIEFTPNSISNLKLNYGKKEEEEQGEGEGRGKKKKIKAFPLGWILKKPGEAVIGEW